MWISTVAAAVGKSFGTARHGASLDLREGALKAAQKGILNELKED